MLEDDLIMESKSPWNFPLIVVPKRPDRNGNKRWRVVVDFRRLNDVTVGDAYPLPNISEILDLLGSSKFFSTLDLANGFHQIEVKPADRPKTAFSTPLGHYQFKRMPYGLKGAPACFQRLMNNVLCGLQGSKVFVYMDDIVVFGRSLEEHNEKLRQVFGRLREHNLKLQPEKCEFLRDELGYLGHVISERGIFPDPSKIDSVKNFPIPKNPKEVKSFLGLAGYYRRFIKDFAKIAKPLTNLLKKNTIFTWTNKCTESFNLLKEHLTNHPILQYPDFTKEFILTTEASGHSIGAILSQGKIGKDLPVAYASRVLNKHEINYSTTDKEFLAVIWAVRHFRPYLYGRKFTIVTDHKPLIHLDNLKDTTDRMVRWKATMRGMEYEIVYKKGSSNTNADCLSRIPQVASVVTNDARHPQSSNSESPNSSIEPSPSYEDFADELENKIILYNLLSDSDEDLLKCTEKTIVVLGNKEVKLDVATETLLGQFGLLEEIASSPKIRQSSNLFKSRNGKNVIFLATHSVTDRPEYEDLFYSFCSLKRLLLEHNISKFSIGNPVKLSHYSHLQYEIIRSMLRYIFRNSKISISVYHNNLNSDLSEEEIQNIIKEYHDKPLGGHNGVNRTYKRIKLNFKWPNMFKDIKRYIKKCDVCKRNKTTTYTKEPMVITSTAKVPFEKISMDIVGPLPTTNSGNRYLLTFVDDLTKFCDAIPITSQESHEVAYKFITEIVFKFGTPRVLLTDQGANFLSSVFKEVCKLLKIKKIQTSAYRPQSNGSCERSHRTLTEYLRSFVAKSQDDWDSWIKYAVFVYNTTPNTSTKFTPFELVFGRKPEIPSVFSNPPEVRYNYEVYSNELKARLQHANALARRNLLSSKERSKEQYDKHAKPSSFRVGDTVFLKNDATQKGKNKKLSNLWSGPYDVISTNGVNSTIFVKNKPVIVHNNRLKPG